MGLESVAEIAAPVSPEKLQVPLPAIVVMMPATTFLMRQFPVSAM